RTLCAHHVPRSSNHWAENNRLMRDLLHRGRVPSRLPPAEREEKFFDAEVVVQVASPFLHRWWLKMTCEDYDERNGPGIVEKAAFLIAPLLASRPIPRAGAVTAPRREEGDRHRTADGGRRPPQVDQETTGSTSISWTGRCRVRAGRNSVASLNEGAWTSRVCSVRHAPPRT